MCDYSLESVQSRPAKVGACLEPVRVGFLRRKTSMLQFAYCPAQSCPSQTRLDGYVCGRGTAALSSTRPRSFARSIRASLGRTTTPWNSLTAKAHAASNDDDRSLFKQALDQFYKGKSDPRTEQLL